MKIAARFLVMFGLLTAVSIPLAYSVETFHPVKPSAPAVPAVELKAFGLAGMTFAQIKAGNGFGSDVDLTSRAGLALGTGMAAEFTLATFHFGHLGLEAGAFYKHMENSGTYSFTLGSLISVKEELTFHMNRFEVPVLVRYHFPRILSFAGGVYYARYFGNVIQDSSVTGSGVSDNSRISGSYSEAGIRQNDFGVVSSVAVNLPVASDTALVADLRSSVGLVNLVQASGRELRVNDLSLLLGVSFAL